MRRYQRWLRRQFGFDAWELDVWPGIQDLVKSSVELTQPWLARRRHSQPPRPTLF